MRASFPKGKQKLFITSILEEYNLSTRSLGEICGVSARTIRDWRREKYTLSENALLQLEKVLHLRRPQGLEPLPDFWYVIKGARKGALRRLELYGPLGTFQSRRKGGLISQQRRRKNPEKYRSLGCNVRKKFIRPKPSSHLAEFIGIVLGDGGISDHQLRITLHKENEAEYIEFVADLAEELFGHEPSKYYFGGRAEKTCSLTLTGTNLVDFLRKLGLKKGSKVLHQAAVPKWILKNKTFSLACLRGLMDTDGGVYYHRHQTKGLFCFNLGLAFSNRSLPLLNFVYEKLSELNFTAKLKQYSVSLYRGSEVYDYFKKVGSNNLYHLKRLEEFTRLKNNWRGRIVA